MGLKKSDVEKMKAKRNVKGLIKASSSKDSDVRSAAALCPVPASPRRV